MNKGNKGNTGNTSNSERHTKRSNKDATFDGHKPTIARSAYHPAAYHILYRESKPRIWTAQ